MHDICSWTNDAVMEVSNAKLSSYTNIWFLIFLLHGILQTVKVALSKKLYEACTGMVTVITSGPDPLHTFYELYIFQSIRIRMLCIFIDAEYASHLCSLMI